MDQEAIDRGQRAEKIVNDPLFVGAFEELRQSILKKIETSPTRDQEGREYCFLLLKALNDVRANLEGKVRDGKYALHLREEKRRFQLFR